MYYYTLYLRDGLEVPLRLLLLDRSGGLGLPVGASLGDGALPAAAAHGDAVDHVACGRTKTRI